MKNNKTVISLILCCACALYSCQDERKDNLMTSKVYIVASGVQEVEMFNTGKTHTYRLGLYKSGAVKTNGTVKLAVCTEAELNEYNTANGTTYKLIGADSYKTDLTEVSFSNDTRDVNRTVEVEFNPAVISTLAANDYVLPLKIESASFEVNESKAMCILHPVITEPYIYFGNSNEKYEYTFGSPDISTSVVAILNAPNEWDISCQITIDEEYTDEYNVGSEIQYELLPVGAYTLNKTATIASSAQQAVFNLGVAVSELPTGNYMLPIRLWEVSKFEVKESASLCVVTVKITSPLLNRSTWTVTANTEEAEGETAPNGFATAVLDGNAGTFWHSQWKGGWAELPHEITIDMQEEYTLTDVDLIRRENNSDTKGGEFYISSDKKSWKEIGVFVLEGTNDVQSFPVSEATGRYLMVKITAGTNGTNTSLAEVMPHGIQ